MLATAIARCKAYGKIDLAKIRLGMSRTEVERKLKRADNLIGYRQYPEGVIEVLQYSRYDPWIGELQERYWFYFLNDKLVTLGRPGDWKREADRIVEYRIK